MNLISFMVYFVQQQTHILDVGEINGLTVDWVSRHVYWTDVERKTVEVADYAGVNRRVLVSTGLEAPRGIVASPLFGYTNSFKLLKHYNSVMLKTEVDRVLK